MFFWRIFGKLHCLTGGLVKDLVLLDYVIDFFLVTEIGMNIYDFCLILFKVFQSIFIIFFMAVTQIEFFKNKLC